MSRAFRLPHQDDDALSGFPGSSGRAITRPRFTMSARAASRPPSKLGLKPGQTIRVEDAILALVTRSANDVASAIGENLAGIGIGLCRADDPHRPFDRNVTDHLPQRIGPAGSRSEDHRARHGHAGLAAAARLPEAVRFLIEQFPDEGNLIYVRQGLTGPCAMH